ncbi:MAG TPA: rRNA maturation RNase YbeY [Actinomycetota bacterium]|nr:rRNA maturation RNase YbeY [Actinomycetota bacterium]
MSDDPPSPRILLSNRQELAIDSEGLQTLATDTLLAEGVADAELSVSLVTREEMADLHERYMGEPGPTDVLSFPQDEDGLLGDVVVCPGVAAEQNPDTGAEIRLLLVHGILHLLGYDHQDEEDRMKMWARQERYTGVRA